MPAPDISPYIATLPKTAVRGEIIPTHVWDEKLDQYVWSVTVYVPKDFTPIGGEGVLAELHNAPRNSKESMLVLKFLDDVTLPPGVDTGIDGALGTLGVDELENGEGFKDVIRVKTMVNLAFTVPPNTFTYRGDSYTLKDYELLHEDKNNRKLVAFYHNVSRTYNDKKWYGEWGGVIGSLTKTNYFPTAEPVVSTNFLTIDTKRTLNLDGTYTLEVFSNSAGSWPVVQEDKVDEQGNVATETRQVVAKGTTTAAVLENDTHVIKTEVEPIDYLRERKTITTEVLEGPAYETEEIGRLDEIVTVVSQVVKRGTATASIDPSGNVVTFNTVNKVDPYREEQVIRTESTLGPELTEVGRAEIDVEKTTVSRIVPVATVVSTGRVKSGANVVETGVKQIDTWRKQRIVSTEPLDGPTLTKIERSELDTEKVIVSKIVDKDTVVTTGRVKSGTDVVETSSEQIDSLRKERVVETEPIDGVALETKEFNQYDVIPSIVEQVIDETNKVAEATFNAGVLTTKEYRKINSLQALQKTRVEELTGPELFESTYNQELGNFTSVIKQVVPRPDLYAIAPWAPGVTFDTGAGTAVVVERKDLDRWRTVKISSTLDFTGMSTYTDGFFKDWATFIEIDLPPEVKNVVWSTSESWQNDAADFAFQVGFELEKLNRVFPAKIYRFYSTKPTTAMLATMIDATDAVTTGTIASKLLDYKIITKDFLVAMSYWGGSSTVQTISTPNAFWDQTLNLSVTLTPEKHDVDIYPGGGPTFAVLGTDFTEKPTVKKVVKVSPKEWFGNLWATDIIVADFANLA